LVKGSFFLLWWGRVGVNSLDSALKDSALKKNAVLTFKTFNAYISAEPDYLPFIAAAGMLLLEANNITESYF